MSKSTYLLQHAFTVVIRDRHQIGEKAAIVVNTFQKDFAEVEKRFLANYRSRQGWCIESITYIGECVEVLEQESTGKEIDMSWLKPADEVNVAL